jgi:RhtB (resistance to homoserine/threonine) family protein
MSGTQFLIFLGAALAITFTPGADTLLVLNNALKHGLRGGVWTGLGSSLGMCVHAFFSIVGLSIILAQSALAFEILKWAGAIYLVYLGIQTIRKRQTTFSPATDEQVVPAKTLTNKKAALQGFLSNILNPKAALFFLVFFPQFIMPNEPIIGQFIVLMTVIVSLNLIWLAIVSLGAVRMRLLFARSKVQRIFDWVSGLLFIGLGIKLAFEKR